MAVAKLSEQEVEAALGGLAGWSVEAGKLHREFRFSDFLEAFAFMTRVALLAERMGHHPEWFNAYNRVTVDLTTHEAGGISQRDVTMAEAIDRIAG